MDERTTFRFVIFRSSTIYYGFVVFLIEHLTFFVLYGGKKAAQLEIRSCMKPSQFQISVGLFIATAILDLWVPNLSNLGPMGVELTALHRG